MDHVPIIMQVLHTGYPGPKNPVAMIVIDQPERETEKAFLIGGEWIPKSMCNIILNRHGERVLVLDEWKAKQVGLI